MHTTLLHGSHHFTGLLIMQTHIRLHHLRVRIVLSELREEFWIFRARQAIKVLHTCLTCKIAKNSFGRKREAPLPADSHCVQALSGHQYRFRRAPVRQRETDFEKMLYRAVYLRNTSSPLGTLQWLVHEYGTFGLSKSHWTPRDTAYHLVIMLRSSTRQTGSSLNCGKPFQPPKLIASLPNMVSRGKSSFPGRLGGDGGKGW